MTSPVHQNFHVLLLRRIRSSLLILSVSSFRVLRFITSTRLSLRVPLHTFALQSLLG
jgi:hypothetical protein